MESGITNSHNIARPLVAVVAVTALLLLLPLIAMQFTTEVRWGAEDFVVAGALLLGTGAGLVLIARYVKTKRFRVAFMGGLVLTLALVWAELAVGIFH